MRKYLSILRLGWLDAVAYRTEFFVSLIGWSIRLFIALYLWLAVTQAKGGVVGGYTFQNIVAYFFLVQIISSFIFSRIGFDIAYDIYKGNFANYLLKPLHYLLFRIIHEVSKNFFRTTFGMLIFGTLLFVFFGGFPLLAWKIPLGLVAMIGAYLLNFCIVATIALSAFWITNSTRLMFIYFGILSIFSGMILPIDLFPPKFLAIFQFLPFPYIFYFPAKIFQAASLSPQLINGFFIQWGSIAVLGGLVLFTYRHGVKKFEAIGR